MWCPKQESHGQYSGSFIITGIRSKLEEALSIVKAAETCAIDRSMSRSVDVLMDFESLVNECQDLFKAALTIRQNLLADAT